MLSRVTGGEGLTLPQTRQLRSSNSTLLSRFVAAMGSEVGAERLGIGPARCCKGFDPAFAGLNGSNAFCRWVVTLRRCRDSPAARAACGSLRSYLPPSGASRMRW